MKKQVDEIILPCVDMGYVELNTTKIIRFYQEMFGPKNLNTMLSAVTIQEHRNYSIIKT